MIIGFTVGFGLSDLGFGLSDLGFGLSDLGFGLSDLGFGLSDLGFGLSDLGSGCHNYRVSGLVRLYLGGKMSALEPRVAPEPITIGALIITYTILGAPYDNYSIIYPKALF